MELPRKNSEHTMVITGYSTTGEGVGHLESGLTVFVRGALRGERCRISILKASKRCAWGRLLAVEEPSPARVTPDCPYYPKCGGCQLRHMSYEEELSLKLGRVNDALQRIGGLPLRAEVIHPAPERTGYRNKVQFPVGPASDGGVRLGFYRRRSHEIVPVERCLLQPEASNQAGQIVRRWMDERQIVPYDETSHTGLVRHLFCRTNAAGELLVCLVVNAGALPEEGELVRRLRAGLPKLAGVVLSKNRERTNVVLGRSFRTLWGRDWLEDTLCGLTFRLSVPSFFQVNRRQAEVLYRRALDFAGLTGRETVLDLYCGTGTISLVMAQRARQVIGAEIVPEAIEDAKANARRNGLENARFLCADAGQAAEMLAGQGIRPDVISVDPPRKGLSHEVIEAICQMAPERVVYVSCDPGTLARDLALLDERGYRAERAEVVDLFPGTGHVETVVLLSKGEVDSKKIRVEFSLEDMDMSEFQDGATYPQIKEYVLEHTGLKVSNLYISQIKRKCGIEVGKNYNLPKSEDSRQPQCPPEKEKAIREAFKYYGMI
ncbi:MAG TPA: 23S rRNA (uracil(1939)-C(5))-methyltransferase RlmD [Candidatus Onthomonas avicola]|nr:23S rRNA (uracil(1939)-C(5))-methyltransferase RlmD [Candidatus Onthomonas avicola]